MISLINPKVYIAILLLITGFNLQGCTTLTTYSGKVKNTDIDSNILTIKTESKDITFNVSDKSAVNIIDIEGEKTVADIGSLLSIDKSGLHEADTAKVVSDSKMFAKKIEATTKRKLRLSKDVVKKKLDEINLGNKLVSENLKLQIENPGTIVGTVTVKTVSPKDTIVYIENINDNKFVAAPKKFVKDSDKLVTRKEKGVEAEFPLMVHIIMQFKPHILPVLNGSIVDMPNMDTVRHNAFTAEPLPDTKEKIFLGTYDVGVSKTIKIDNPGEVPLLCNMHKEMSGYVVSLENPYFALTDKNGSFVIDNVPPGKYVLKTWHKLFKPVIANITVDAGETTKINLPDIKKRR